MKSISVFITLSKFIKRKTIKIFAAGKHRTCLGALVAIFLATITSCRDIAFNNPLDPNASKEALKIIRVIDTPFGGPGDAAFDGEKFWKINSYGDLLALDRESGTMIRSFSIISGTGVSFFRGAIYLSHGKVENILYKADPLSGDILDRQSTRDLYPGYLAVSTIEDRLIIYDVRSEGIFHYDPETGNATRLFQAAGIAVGGIETYKGGLLVTDMNSDAIYFFTMNGSVIDVFLSPAPGVGGVAVDNSDYIYLFMMDGKIYKVSLP
ncbi:MAG: hypothetical protein MUF15_16250 [Acidobacteria bacterium]|jgi:outer membrane protein assembly factor BamB|nr:hypothetical protein [Acidobacteriota bacterium]